MYDSEFEDAYEDNHESVHKGQAEDYVRSAILNTPISELALRKPILVDASTPVVDAVHAMREQHLGCVLVQKAERLVGIVTERDILNRVVFQNENRSMLVESIMTQNPETLGSHESTAFALNMMSVGGYRHIPIVEPEGIVIGVLSVQDIVAFLVELFPADILNLPTNPEMGIARRTDGG
jgi:CBS domain-containing protein